MPVSGVRGHDQEPRLHQDLDEARANVPDTFVHLHVYAERELRRTEEGPRISRGSRR